MIVLRIKHGVSAYATKLNELTGNIEGWTHDRDLAVDVSAAEADLVRASYAKRSNAGTISILDEQGVTAVPAATRLNGHLSSGSAM
jgi:hypothetical protein